MFERFLLRNGRFNLETVARAVLPGPAPGRFFSDAERRTLMALAEVVLEGAPARVPVETVADNVDALLRRGGSQRAWRVRVLYTLVELAPVLLLRKDPFSRLPLDERRRIVAEHFRSGHHLWAICAKARHLINLGLYADPRAHEAIGFVPIPERERYARRQTAT